MITFRRARENELDKAFEVFYANEVHGLANPPALPTRPPRMLAHILRTGSLCVAEENDQILAFAGAIIRDEITFLTDLFVHPARQSSHLGATLLQSVCPPGGTNVRCTLSSSDPRAQALYIRAGMHPRWPHFSLVLEDTTHAHILSPGLEVVEASTNDPALLTWDAHVSGRQRPQDHAFWASEQGGVPLWFRRAGETVGYGYVCLDAGTIAYPGASSLGPIGATTPEDAAACVLAAVHWAGQRAGTLVIEVPGPHPCLPLLLETHFHIRYADIYMTSEQTPFFDPTCYIASDSSLF